LIRGIDIKEDELLGQLEDGRTSLFFRIKSFLVAFAIPIIVLVVPTIVTIYPHRNYITIFLRQSYSGRGLYDFRVSKYLIRKILE